MKHWHILQSYPYLKSILPPVAKIIFKGHLHLNSTRRNHIHRHKRKVSKCLTTKCKCCEEINNKAKTFKSNQTDDTFSIKYPLTCKSSYIIYHMECPCGLQYIGRTIQPLHRRMNKHRTNIRKKFLLQSVSTHYAMAHSETVPSISITLIDHIPLSTHNRSATLKKT